MPEFSELLRRARTGDASAVTTLYETYRGRVERIARRALGTQLQSRYDTADIAQSVFGDLLGDLHAFEDRGEAAFNSWLGVAVRHKVVDKARRQTLADGRVREQRLDTQAGGRAQSLDGAPDDVAGLREEQARMTRLLGTLDASQRTAICLFLDEGLSWDEVAARLGLPSAAAARMRYVRAIALLRERWTRA